MAPDRAGDVTVDDAGNNEEEEDERHDALHEGRACGGELAVRSPCGALGRRRGCQNGDAKQHGNEPRAKAAALLIREIIQRGGIGQIAVQGLSSEPRLHDSRGQVPTQEHD